MRTTRFLFLYITLCLFISNSATASTLSGSSLLTGQLDLYNTFLNYMGLGTTSIDKAEFGEAFACISIDGVGGQAIGWLFDNGSYPETSYVGVDGCSVNGLRNLFSGFVCVYENTLSSILGNMLCSVQALVVEPLGAALTLYVTCLGLMFLTGMMNVTAKDIMSTLLRIILVMTFATDAEMFVDIIYRGIMSFVQEGTNAIIESLYLLGLGMGQFSGVPDVGVGNFSVLQRLDSMVYDFLEQNVTGETKGNECKGAVVEMTLSFLGSAPPLAFMGLSMLFTLTMMLIRTVFGYLIALTGIMFLCAIAPIFLAFALFQFTRSLFDEWVNQLVGFALQILVVLAFISMVVSLPIQTIFGFLYDLAAPVQSTLSQSNTRMPMKNWCTFCTEGVDGNTANCKNSVYQGQDSDALQPSDQASNIGFISFSTTIIIFLLVLSRILEATIRIAPSVAQGLSSAPYAPKLYADHNLSKPRSKSKPTQTKPQSTSETGNKPNQRVSGGKQNTGSDLVRQR